jgi:hypothetical protein
MIACDAAAVAFPCWTTTADAGSVCDTEGSSPRDDDAAVGGGANATVCDFVLSVTVVAAVSRVDAVGLVAPCDDSVRTPSDPTPARPAITAPTVMRNLLRRPAASACASARQRMQTVVPYPRSCAHVDRTEKLGVEMGTRSASGGR